jgi:hypothetical protein
MIGNEEQEDHANVAQKIVFARRAIEAGIIKTLPEHAQFVEELRRAPIGPLGLIDTSRMSQEAIAFARVVGLAARLIYEEQPTLQQLQVSTQDVQCELFRHFTHLFVALTGTAPDTVSTTEQIKALMMALIGSKDHEQFTRQVNAVIEELGDFYKKYRLTLYRDAKKLGGVKLVGGGQRAFGPSALQGIRISGLYADTQLIPDPVYPHLTANLHLNAAPLQMATDLFYLLRLKPLVDARLPVPPVFVFPSFEQELQAHDPVTMTGFNDLVVAVVGSAFDETFTRVEELLDFAGKHEERFVTGITRRRLFIPPGSNPIEQLAPEEAARRYLAELEGVRSGEAMKTLNRLPLGVLMLNGIIERLQPQFHLLENSEELGAQPLLTQAVHWHYFERCADANARSLIQKKILTEQGFASLRALHDNSLTWLANIPVDGLAELHRNLEHQAFRDELKKYTSQLAAAGPLEIDDVVREVNTGLALLLSKQEKALRDIEDRYSPKKWGAYAGGALGGVTAASVLLMPTLAPLLGAGVPAALSAAAAGAIGGFAKEKIGEIVEKKRASKTLLGVLAVAKNAGQ